MKKFMTVILALCMLLSLTACGSKGTSETSADSTASSVSPEKLEEIYTELVNYKDMAKMSQMTPTMALNLCGIREEDSAVTLTAICSTGLEAHEIWVLEATGAESLAHLKELAQKRITQKGEETKTYNPEQYKMVEKAQVVTSGNYLALIVAPHAEEMADFFLASVQQ